MENRGPDRGRRKDLKGKDHLLYEVRVACNDGGCDSNDLGQKLELREAEEDGERVVDPAFIGNRPEFSAEHIAKNKDVQAQHQKWVKKAPNQTKMAAAVTELNVTYGELSQQVDSKAEAAKGIHGWRQSAFL